MSMVAAVSLANAQDSTNVSPLQISGSVDAYYKYDFAGLKGGTGNIPTSFASDNNSVSLGMIDLALKKTTGKASFVGELSFGPRGQYQSIPNGDGNDDNSFHIQNLYMTYAFSDKFSMTGGYMGTFIGYEVISPVANFNYSTSYLFTWGPFQNAGIKANFTFSDKVALMVGLFNDWNTYKDVNGVSHFGAQLSLTPITGWTSYLNVLTGHSAPDAAGTGTVLDLTTAYQMTSKFKLGLNAATYSTPDDNASGAGYSGVALYPQYAVSNDFSLGLRGEYFKPKDSGSNEYKAVTSFTVSGNIKAGALTVIPEVRFDSQSGDGAAFYDFLKSNGNTMKSASQFSIAAVYAF